LAYLAFSKSVVSGFEAQIAHQLTLDTNSILL
jgi:hypothetical protein